MHKAQSSFPDSSINGDNGSTVLGQQLQSSSGDSSGSSSGSCGSGSAALVPPRGKRHPLCLLLDSSLDNFSLTNILEWLTMKDISLVLSLVKSTTNVPAIFVPSEKLLREVLKKCLIKGIIVRGDLRKTLRLTSLHSGDNTSTLAMIRTLFICLKQIKKEVELPSWMDASHISFVQDLRKAGSGLVKVSISNSSERGRLIFSMETKDGLVEATFRSKRCFHLGPAGEECSQVCLRDCSVCSEICSSCSMHASVCGVCHNDVCRGCHTHPTISDPLKLCKECGFMCTLCQEARRNGERFQCGAGPGAAASCSAKGLSACYECVVDNQGSRFCQGCEKDYCVSCSEDLFKPCSNCQQQFCDCTTFGQCSTCPREICEWCDDNGAESTETCASCDSKACGHCNNVTPYTYCEYCNEVHCPTCLVESTFSCAYCDERKCKCLQKKCPSCQAHACDACADLGVEQATCALCKQSLCVLCPSEQLPDSGDLSCIFCLNQLSRDQKAAKDATPPTSAGPSSDSSPAKEIL